MSDGRVRSRQRTAAMGGPEDEVRLLRERLYASTMTMERLALAALCGHEPARAIVPEVRAGRRSEECGPPWAWIDGAGFDAFMVALVKCARRIIMRTVQCDLCGGRGWRVCAGHQVHVAACSFCQCRCATTGLVEVTAEDAVLTVASEHAAQLVHQGRDPGDARTWLDSHQPRESWMRESTWWRRKAINMAVGMLPSRLVHEAIKAGVARWAIE